MYPFLRMNSGLAGVIVFAGCVSLFAVDPPSGGPTQEYDWEANEKLKEDGFAKLPLDSQLLRSAYSQVFLRSESTPDSIKAARSDLIRRGDAVTPVLLDLFKENPEGEFRARLLQRIDVFPSIDVVPYVQAARELYASEGVLVPARTGISI